jgi:hypothetical protein
VIDVFVDELDLTGLGFDGVEPEVITAAPSARFTRGSLRYAASWACSSKACVAIDGNKFKAVNNRDKNFTRAKMDRRMAQIEESVARYLQQLDSATSRSRPRHSRPRRAV